MVSISVLCFFADDVALLATSMENLQRMVDVACMPVSGDLFSMYPNASQCHLVWSLRIAQVLVLVHVPILNGNVIKNSRIVKYLGLELNFKVSWSDYKERIASKARSALATICSMGLENLSVAAAINLYAGLVRSHLEYGAEIWVIMPGLKVNTFKISC